MRVRRLFSIILSLCLCISTRTFAQNCTILSKSESCLGEFIGFSIQSNGTPTQYSWDFGDGSTSSDPQPAHTYATAGVKNLKVKLTFANGNTCDATRTVTVFHPPVADFSIDRNSNLCLNNNKVCITDNSKPGPSGNALNRHIILWGDGDTTSNNYPAPSRTSCHSYTRSATYTILMEVTDTKGCHAKKAMTVPIMPDIRSSFTYSVNRDSRTCKTTVCFNNTSTADSAYFKSHYWVLNNKTRIDTSFQKICFETDSSTTFSMRLVMTNKNGCSDSFSDNISIQIPTFNFNITLPDRVCVGTVLTLHNRANNDPAQYTWTEKDSATKRELLLEYANTVQHLTQFLGKYYFKQTIEKDGCSQSHIDSVDVIGPSSAFSVLNGNQCSPKDSVIFCAPPGGGFKSYNIVRLWDFKDGEMCTTDIQKGKNLGKNCRWSNDYNESHWYKLNPGSRSDCFGAALTLIDTVTRCTSASSSPILFGIPAPGSVKLNYTVTQPCNDKTETNPARQYDFTLSKFSCNEFMSTRFIYDSSRMASTTLPFAEKPRLYIYDDFTEQDGLLTVGIIFSNGGGFRYKDCNMTVIDSNPTCSDTMWFHDFVKIYREPDPEFTVPALQGCKPNVAEFTWKDSIQKDLRYMYVDYDVPGEKDTFQFNASDSILPKLSFTYQKYGIYNPYVLMRNIAGCQNYFRLELATGYYNRFNTDSTLCKGETVEFRDSLRYFNKIDTFWRKPRRSQLGLENIRWDFDDGRGFATTGPLPKHIFQSAGIFTVRMVSKDSGLCQDTFSMKVYVTDLDAQIQSMRDTFFCNDNIIQFFDSTRMTGSYDSIVSYLWNFDTDNTPRTVKNPSYYFNAFGTRTIRLIAGTRNGCADTAYRNIYIKGPLPSFEIITDSVGCVPLTVTLKNTSESSSAWIWYMDDPKQTNISTDKDSNITFTYTTPGTYYLKLYSADSIYNSLTKNYYYCSALYPEAPKVKKVIVQPIPEATFQMPEKICQGEAFSIINTSDTTYKIYDWDMDNGDRIHSQKDTNFYTYNTAGTYEIVFTPSYPVVFPYKLCLDTARKNIKVLPITANFTIDPNSVEPFFTFINHSLDAVKYEWDFGHPASGNLNISNEVNPTHNYRNSKGRFKVCLVSWNENDCPDTFCREVENNFEPRLDIPNVFTPEGEDTLNGRFDIDIFGELLYDLRIYNRWGELMFESKADGENNQDVRNWNGRKFNTGAKCPSGVYYIVFGYELNGYDPAVYRGSVTLIRPERE